MVSPRVNTETPEPADFGTLETNQGHDMGHRERVIFIFIQLCGIGIIDLRSTTTTLPATYLPASTLALSLAPGGGGLREPAHRPGDTDGHPDRSERGCVGNGADATRAMKNGRLVTEDQPAIRFQLNSVLVEQEALLAAVQQSEPSQPGSDQGAGGGFRNLTTGGRRRAAFRSPCLHLEELQIAKTIRLDFHAARLNLKVGEGSQVRRPEERVVGRGPYLDATGIVEEHGERESGLEWAIGAVVNVDAG